jgi:hypothetical protein
MALLQRNRRGLSIRLVGFAAFVKRGPRYAFIRRGLMEVAGHPRRLRHLDEAAMKIVYSFRSKVLTPAMEE